MEPRKLIRLGNSSFAIALPKDWIEKSGLNKGDEVYVERNSNGEIIISTKFKKAEDKKIDIHSDKEDALKKNFHAAYTKGYNIVSFKGEGLNSKFLKGLLSDYLSFEIVEAKEKEIITKDFFDINEAKFENFVKRMDNDIREIFTILIESIKNDKLNPKAVKEIHEIDKSINKFYFLCSRIFVKGIDNPTILNILKMNGNQLFNNWWMTLNLESLGDGLKYTANWISKLNPANKGEIYNVLLKLQANYIKSVEAFIKNDNKKAMEVIHETKQIAEDIDGLEPEKISRITNALEMVRKNIYQNSKIGFYMQYG